MNPAKRAEIYRRLRDGNPAPTTELHYTTPFELLVATVLSAQTTDVRVNMTTPALFARFPDAVAMAGADEVERRANGFRIVAYDTPRGCAAAYYPETNPLVPLALHDEMSKTPAYKGTPVRIEAMAG